MNTPAQLPAHVENELLRLKAYFPFRICFAANNGDEWIIDARSTEHRAMNLLRKGWKVWYIGYTEGKPT